MLNDIEPGPFKATVEAMRGDSSFETTGEEAIEPASVQSLREMRGLSVLDLAGLAGMLPDHITAIEAGVEPTTPERQAIAAALNVPVDRIA